MQQDEFQGGRSISILLASRAAAWSAEVIWEMSAMRNRLIVFAAMSAAIACAGCQTTQHKKHQVFGSPWPGNTPELIAPGIINTDGIEINLVFTSDYRELIFSRREDGVFYIHSARRGPSGWRVPERLNLFPDDPTAEAVDMTLSPDDNKLYFLGITQSNGKAQTDIYVSQRNDLGWSPAQIVPAPVSTEHEEIYPVVTADGSLWFASNRPGTRGVRDLYRARSLPDGSFAEPVAIGPPIDAEWRKGDTTVSPDQGIIVMSGTRPGGYGRGDLYISFRQDDGSYSEPKNMGPQFNSELLDFCPMFSPDGRWFSFSRRYGDSWPTATDAEIFWVSAKALEQFRID